VGAAAAQAACRQRAQVQRLLAGARAERTMNIAFMVVTLDVSQLSGWLNAVAYCRVERESIKRGARAGRREIVGAAAAQAACRQRAQVQRLLAGARSRGAHVKHAVYGRDAGGVEAQRLVEGRRSLPSRKGRHKKSGERRTYGRGRAWARRRRKQRVQAEDPTVEAAGRGTRGAHVKHAVHGRDAGGVPAQRLVERVRVLPSRKGKHNKRGDRQAWRREGVGAVAAQAACRQRTRLWRLLAGARAERT